MDSLTSKPLAEDSPHPDRSLVDDVRQLAEDARAYAEAELAYQKARAGFAAQEMKWIALALLLAGVLVFFAIGALTVGLLLALTPLISAFGATAAVVGGLLVFAAIAVLRSLRRWKRMSAALAGERDPE